MTLEEKLRTENSPVCDIFNRPIDDFIKIRISDIVSLVKEACEKQREVCAKVFDEKSLNNQYEVIPSIYGLIKYAPEPIWEQ